MLLLILSLLCLASAKLAPLYTHPEGGIDGQYIVSLKEAPSPLERRVINKRFHAQRIYRDGAFHGFAGRFDEKLIEMLRKMPLVAYVEQDSVVRSQGQGVTSWGLDRVNQRKLPLDGKAQFTGTGKGVNAYIIDTGIYPNNNFFSDRAFVAYDAVNDSYGGIDCNGHGTHCSGTIGGEVFGIAREANLFGVKVLGCGGSGTTSGVIAGMDFVATCGKRPAVASMSLGGRGSPALDEAVKKLFDSGVTVSVAAGNDRGDACKVSPARSPEAITVGATNIEDEKAPFSNFGKCVNIFAPGVDIPSLWIGGDYAVNTISGTSMACPHVTGGAVLALGNNPELDPSEVKEIIYKDGTPDVVKNPGPESPNLMLYIP